MISVFLPSYNKGAYVLDAMRSVFNQTRTDWELWILENSTDGVTRELIETELWAVAFPPGAVHYERIDHASIPGDVYPTAWLLNCYYPEANGEYIFYISDDDLIDPDCFEHMAGDLDANPDHNVVWASIRAAGCKGPGDTGPFRNEGIPAFAVKGMPGSADCLMDGGQVMHRKQCLDVIGWPYFETSNVHDIRRHADGIFLENLLRHFPFHPVPRWLITHRYTPLSVMASAPNLPEDE